MRDKGLSLDQIERLRRVDTPTLCNVIELFNVRARNTGYMDARIRACFAELPPLVGYAATATFRSASPSSGGGVYGSVDKQVAGFADLPGPAAVVFQDLDDPPTAATFGEVMCTAYKAFGAAGLITSGAGRDLDQVRALDFPVFTGGTLCAHGYCHIPSINVPVSVGGLTIHPGQLLHGDRNGVTTIPEGIADEVGPVCDEYVAAEEVVFGYLRSGSPTPKGLAEAQAECRRLIAALAERVSRG